MRRVSLVAVAVLLAGFIVWWLAQDGSTQPPIHPGAARGQPVDSTVAANGIAVSAAAVSPASNVGEPEVEREAAPAPELPASERPLSLLRGRCVDLAGNPIAGIAASFLGWGANQSRTDEWRRENPEPQRLDENRTTGVDGVFEFRFWPPPPFQFAVRLQGAGRATWSGRWHEIAIGQNVELGDVELPAGTLLRGRVVDADGAPVGGVSVRINSKGGRRSVGGYESWCTARTQDDGTFASRWALLAGDYEFGIDDHPIDHPQQLTLAGDEQFVEIVLQRITTMDAISGVVVDESGAPVARAMIRAVGVHTGRINQTDREGHFRVLRPAQDAPETVRITAMHDSYSALPAAGTSTGTSTEASAVPESYAWGRNDVRIVLRKGGEVAVLAVRAADETPVEDYVLRVVPVSTGFLSSNDQRPRGGDHHEGGREPVEGIRQGTHLVIVEPRDSALAIGMAPLEVTATGAASVVVRLAATNARSVRVQRADGSPIHGTRVQLVDPLGEPLTADVPICSVDRWGYTTARKALELAAAETDVAGEVELPTPVGRPLALFVAGPLHAPLLVPNAVFPAVGPLVLTVESGATLRGTIGPVAVLEEIRRLAGIAAGAVPEPRQWPNVYLVRDRSLSPSRFPEPRAPCALQPDGSFELNGIPPGTWNLTVLCCRVSRDGRGGHWLEEPGGEVVLRDGETTTVALDFRRIVPGQLSGRVLHNGAPLANTAVNLQTKIDDPTGQFPFFYEQVTTDVDGQFEASVRSGEYTLRWSMQKSAGWITLRAPERALVVTGQRTEATFHVQSGTLKLRLVDASGKAIVGAPLELRDAAGVHRMSAPPTDADGRCEVQCDALPLTAWVLPRRLQDRESLMAFYQAHAGETDPLANVRIPLGDVTLRAGETVELELRAPATFDR